MNFIFGLKHNSYLNAFKTASYLPGGSRTYFSRLNDTLKQKIWRERIGPYIEDEIFKVMYLNLFTNEKNNYCKTR